MEFYNSIIEYTHFVTKEHGTFHINWPHIVPQKKTRNYKIERERKQNSQTILQ